MNCYLDIIRFYVHLCTEDIYAPPLGIVVTKCDLIEDKWIPYIEEILQERFDALVASEITVMLSAVSASDSVNLEQPFAFATMCVLAERIRLMNLLPAKNNLIDNLKYNALHALKLFSTAKPLYVGGIKVPLRQHFQMLIRNK